MQRYLARLGLTIAYALNCSAAFADWENTHWGMTVDEAKSVLSHVADVEQKDQFDEESKPYRRLLWTVHTVGQHHFGTYFYFLGGQLALVNMTPLDVSCDMLAVELTEKYGLPEKLSSDSATGLRWHVANDRVQLLHQTVPPAKFEACGLFYSPWPSAAS